MKSYLKSVLAVFLIFVCTNIEAQIKFGPKVGMNMSTMTMKTMGISLDPKTLIGFHIGAICEIALGDNFALQPGILYSSKGSKFQVSTESATISPSFVEVPVNAAYSFGPGDIKFSVFAGPYAAYGIGGKWESGGESSDISFGSGDNDDMKPFDFGLNFGVGANIQNFLISVQYGIGLANLSPDTSNDTEFKNKVIGISLAYLFGGK
jgi:hypothetical protein